MAFLPGAVVVLPCHCLGLRGDYGEEIEEHTELKRTRDRVGRERTKIGAEDLRVLNVDGFAWGNEGV